MNENLNLVEALKDCSQGTKLYSPIYGDVELVKVSQFVEYPIEVKLSDNSFDGFSNDGRINVEYSGECLLFPSKDQRDWSKFVPPCKFKDGDKIVNGFRKYIGASVTQGVISEITDDKYIFTDGSYISISNQDSWKLVPDRFDPKTLKPFDKVLVRDYPDEVWNCSILSHRQQRGMYNYTCTNGANWKYCIPYNDDTKHLVGINKEAPEFYRYWED